MRSSPYTTDVLDCSPVSRRGATAASASRGKRSVRAKRTEPPRTVARVASRSNSRRSPTQNPGSSKASDARIRAPSRSSASENPPGRLAELAAVAHARAGDRPALRAEPALARKGRGQLGDDRPLERGGD